MLDKLKLLLGLKGENDEGLDELLSLIISSATSRLKILLGGIEPPESMDYIILEVSVIRYNKIGSEGFSSHTVEGESMSFNDDDFSSYKGEIQSYLDSLKESTKGKVRFL